MNPIWYNGDLEQLEFFHAFDKTFYNSLSFSEKLETDNNSATEQVQRLLGEKHTKSVEIAMLSKELKELKNSSLTSSKSILQRGDHQTKIIQREAEKPSPLDRYAITIVNSNGKVTSPFETKK